MVSPVMRASVYLKKKDVHCLVPTADVVSIINILPTFNRDLNSIIIFGPFNPPSSPHLIGNIKLRKQRKFRVTNWFRFLYPFYVSPLWLSRIFRFHSLNYLSLYFPPYFVRLIYSPITQTSIGNDCLIYQKLSFSLCMSLCRIVLDNLCDCLSIWPAHINE